MELSVVVSTLNDRERLLSCLDALTERTPSSTEVIVVNGPSSDGTTGVVRDRGDVDVLVEISERNSSVSRNAGLEVATGEIVAFLDGEYAIEHSWYPAIDEAMAGATDVVTGPVTGSPASGDRQSPQQVAGRSVTHVHGGNVAFERSVLEALNGFDEYLEEASERDCAHRLAGLEYEVSWDAAMAARREIGTDGGEPIDVGRSASELRSDGGRADPDWGATYRSLSYRLAKNYGLRPSVLARTVGSALGEAAAGVRRLAAGEATPTGWVSDGTAVVTNVTRGLWDGVRARYGDRSSRRNPNGIAERHDRAVRVYDWR
ncbi:glycosyltransferase family 2 protein [Natrinema sp. H-ect4]|uniref:glycosyltransferase family 2 protein n=1 Tax=Natrinema sp. H-ect4 TaxID=3242699 RepID=UPI0035A97810